VKLFSGFLRRSQDACRFEYLGHLGSGGEGSVELLWDRQLARRVTCKQLYRSEASRTGSEMALDVARRLASITGDGVPRVLQLLSRNGHNCLLIEYTEGVSLERLRSQAVPVWGDIEILSFVLDLARTVSKLHQGGVVHGDISPANVLIDPMGSVRLVDFGQAAAMGQCFNGAITPGFSAPECTVGVTADPSLDVYGIGALLQWLLHPFKPNTPDLSAWGRVNGALNPSHNPSHLRTTLHRCAEMMLSPLPERRPALDVLIADWVRLERQTPVSAQKQWVTDAKMLSDNHNGLDADKGVHSRGALAEDATCAESVISFECAGEPVEGSAGEGALERAEKTSARSNAGTPESRFRSPIGQCVWAYITRLSTCIPFIAAVIFTSALLRTVMVTAIAEGSEPHFAINRFEVAAVTRLPVALDRAWLLSRLDHHGRGLGGYSGMQGAIEGAFELSVVCMGQVCQLGLWRSDAAWAAHQSLVLAGSELALWDGAIRDLLRLAVLPLAND